MTGSAGDKIMQDHVTNLKNFVRPQPNSLLPWNELEFRRLLEKLPAAAYMCDTAGLITYFNRQAAELWGRAPKLSDPVDRFCGSFKLHSPDSAPIRHDECWMALALQGNKEYNGHEIVVERPDGSRLTALAYANPIRDESGVLLGAVNVLVDITDRKRAEAALKEADRRKDEFLATLAHELRNPLAPICNGLEILRLAGRNRQATEQVLGMLERQVQHMVRLVDDLLEVSRITRGKVELRKEHVELAAVVATALETSRPLIQAAGHELTVTLPSDPLVLDADPVRLAQVLSNLLNNAAKYTDQGGRIALSAERQGNEIVVRVRDSGIGIPPMMLPHVFEMFTQGDPSMRRMQDGLGVGLTVVKSLVHVHGGSVEVDSAGPGRGSEFTVRLPAALALCPSGDAASQSGRDLHAKPLRKCRILIADDNPDEADSLGTLLRLKGSDVRVVYDGSAALEAMVSYRPAVVLLDIGMAGMDGHEVARRVRQQADLKHVVLIALTGWGQEEDRRRCRESGFDHHLIKPVDLDALQMLLASLPQPMRLGRVARTGAADSAVALGEQRMPASKLEQTS